MNPIIQIDLLEGPLGPHSSSELSDEQIGAVVVFEGIVRREEAGRDLESLCYEAYEPMTSNELRKLCQETVKQHQLKGITVEHSVGTVRVGEKSFRLTLTSSHRAEAIAACDAFIVKMKKDVPLWKRPVYRTS